ncbi:MAG: phosphate ABC transporter ATP-binding protein [Desulfatirhabdiaceae bacterium]
MEPAVVISNLEVLFSGKAVLKDIHLSLWPGRITVLVGPSGSGKSTLLRAINRLNEFFPDCQTRGSVSLHLQNQYHGDIYKNTIPLSDLRRRVGMVFQTPAVLPFSIEKNITMPLQVTVGLTGSALTERMTRALQEVALWDEVKDRLKSSANTLSGGQQQRLCLARVLALEPQILLLDEPTASLDYKSAARIESLLLKLKERYTILAVSHSLSQTRRIADRVCVLRQGQLIQEMDRNDIADVGAFQGLMEAAF